MIKLGNDNIGKLYLGQNEIGKAYLGSELVHQKGSSPSQSQSWQDAGLDNIQKEEIAINGINNMWFYVVDWCSKFLPCSPGGIYKVIAGSGGVTNYAFMKSNAYSRRTAVTTFATGSALSDDIPANGNSGAIVAPSDAQYLYVLVQTGNGTMNGVVVQQYV